MSSTTLTPEPILAPEEALRFMRRRRFRRWAARMLLAVLLLVALILGPSVLSHIGMYFWLSALGARVDWSFNDDDWKQGGVTAVSFPITFRIGGEFKNRDIASLRRLHRLESLDLANVFDVSELGLADLKLLPELKILDLTRVDGPVVNVTAPAPRLSDKVLRSVKPLANLRELYLKGNHITDDGLAELAGMTSLEILDLEETRVTDAGLRHLKGLKNLKDLRLAGTKVTQEGAMDLNQAVPDVVIHRKKEFEDE